MADNEEVAAEATTTEVPTMPEQTNEETSENNGADQTDVTNGQAAEEDAEAKTEEAAGDKPVEEGSLISATEDNESKMFVGGLSWDTETFGLKDYFSKFGVVKDCTIKKDSKTERSRGFGFVLFEDAASIQKVMDVPVHHLDGRKIDPKRAQAQRKDGKVFVGGVSTETSNDKIKEHFSKFGEIEVFERPVDKATGKNRGFCFITYKKDGILKLACAEKSQELDGNTVEVKEAQNQDRGKFMGRGGGRGGGWGPGPGYGASGGYGGYGNYGYDMFGGGGYGGGYNQGGYGNYGNFGGGGYGGGGKTMKARGGSGRPHGGAGGWGQTRSSHTSWQGNRGNFHGAYQGYHDY